MDMIREEYSQYIRPYYDSDEKVLVKWYRAAPDAKLVRPYTCFGSSARSELKRVPVGEVWDRQTYTRGSWGNFGGYLGVRSCSTRTGLQRGVSINQVPLNCKCVRLKVVPIQENPAGVVDGTNRVFTLSQMPISNQGVLIFINIGYQVPGTDYSITGQTVTFAAASRPQVGSVVWAYYWVYT
jgi:hypothetical protein